MFWIGLILGAAITVGLHIGYYVWLFKELDITSDEASDMGNLLIKACENRECTLVVEDTEGSIIDEYTLEEK